MTPEIAAERWVEGMLKTSPVPCPVCNRKTRAEYSCQYCKAVFSSEQIELRRQIQKKTIAI